MAYESIFFGTVDSAAIEAETIAKFTELSGYAPNPSDPEYIVLLTMAYCRVLSKQDIDRAGKGNLVDFASGGNLDYIAKIQGLSRIPDGPSITRCELTLVTGHAQVVIPAGFLITSQDGTAQYATNEPTTVPVGIDVIVVPVTCTTDGSFSNNYAADTITVIQNPQPYLISATNLDVTSGGADIETDASFRARWYAGLKALAVAGPKGGYKFHALTAALTIIDVNVLGPEDGGVVPGSVEIRVLVDTGVPTQAILDAVFAACDPIEVRPTCDTVIVKAVNMINYSLNIGLTVFDGADTAAIPALVLASIKAYTDLQGDSIGFDVVDDAITAAGKLADVKEVHLNGFNTISVNDRSCARCTGITVNITSVEAP